MQLHTLCRPGAVPHLIALFSVMSLLVPKKPLWPGRWLDLEGVWSPASPLGPSVAGRASSLLSVSSDHGRE